MRDALDVAQSPIRTSAIIKLPDARDNATFLFDFLWSSVRPSEKTAILSSGIQAVELVKIADKYNVSALVHNAYMLVIMQAEDRGWLETYQWEALIYAVNYRDPWLCHYIVSRLTKGDPVGWTKDEVNLLGFDFWFALLQAFPRSSYTTDNNETRWARAAAKISWKELLKK
jgi:hypothetical protein